MTSYEQIRPDEPRGWSPLAVALIATLVLLLGLAGALFGIYVANVNAAAVAATSTVTVTTIAPTATAPATPTTPTTPRPTPTVTPTATSTLPEDSISMPALIGMNFKAARDQVRALHLDWVLVFGTGSDPAVLSTDPPAGALLTDSSVVTIKVKGSAPPATAPAIAGQPCAAAAAKIVDAGLIPQYGSAARAGLVLAGPPQTGLRWNDKMKLTCSGG